MARTISADITPSVLRWARETLGLSIEEAASKLKISANQLVAWESGEAAPSVAKLRNIADIYKRPIAIFFLEVPPVDVRPPKDYRRLPDNVDSPLSPRLRLEIRRATYRQSIAAQLGARRRTKLLSLCGKSSLSDNVESLAALARSVLGISVQVQSSWREPWIALSQWITALEAQGILVFQASGVDVSEMRGASVPHESAPAILLNAADAPAGRVFTLFHELAHFLLGENSLCDLCDWEQERSQATRTEVFCNGFSASFLIPHDALLSNPVVQSHQSKDDWDDQELDSLRREFAVSKEAITRRLVSVRKASMGFYLSKRNDFLQAGQLYREQLAKHRGGPPPYRRILASNGPSFTRLVIDAYREEEITGSELSEYLGTKLQHLTKIEETVFAQGAG